MRRSTSPSRSTAASSSRTRPVSPSRALVQSIQRRLGGAAPDIGRMIADYRGNKRDVFIVEILKREDFKILSYRTYMFTNGDKADQFAYNKANQEVAFWGRMPDGQEGNPTLQMADEYRWDNYTIIQVFIATLDFSKDIIYSDFIDLMSYVI